MGEARRRKKLLGSQYGKRTSSNSRIAIFSGEESNRQTEQSREAMPPGLSLSRPPIPELGHLKSKITSIELENWVVAQWNNLSSFRTLVSEEEAHRNASVILRKLGKLFPSNQDSDHSVSCNISPLIEIAVGINVYSWTVWASVGDGSTSFLYITSDADEFRLVCH